MFAHSTDGAERPLTDADVITGCGRAQMKKKNRAISISVAFIGMEHVNSYLFDSWKMNEWRLGGEMMRAR